MTRIKSMTTKGTCCRELRISAIQVARPEELMVPARESPPPKSRSMPQGSLRASFHSMTQQ